MQPLSQAESHTCFKSLSVLKIDCWSSMFLVISVRKLLLKSSLSVCVCFCVCTGGFHHSRR